MYGVLILCFSCFSTEDTADMPEYQKEKIECADFCALDWKFHGVNVNPKMKTVLKAISWQNRTKSTNFCDNIFRRFHENDPLLSVIVPAGDFRRLVHWYLILSSVEKSTDTHDSFCTRPLENCAQISFRHQEKNTLRSVALSADLRLKVTLYLWFFLWESSPL